jgi:hypothetical protein
MWSIYILHLTELGTQLLISPSGDLKQKQNHTDKVTLLIAKNRSFIAFSGSHTPTAKELIFSLHSINTECWRSSRKARNSSDKLMI